MARGQDGVEIQSMIDLVLVKRDIYAALCAGCEGKSPCVILSKVRLMGAWTKRREVTVRARRLKSERN